MYASSNTFLDRRSPERLQPLKHDSCALCTITDGLDIAVLLNNDDKLPSPLGSPYTMGSGRAELDGADPATQNRGPLHLLSAPPPLPSPTVTPCGPKDWPLRTARQAKRARVENIIRDMAGSSFSPSLEPDTEGAPEDGQGDGGPREWPPEGVQAQRAGRSSVVGCWSSEDPAVKDRPQNVKCQPLLKFRRSGGLPPEDWERDPPKEETPLEETHSFASDSPSKDPNDIFTDPHCGDGLDVPLNGKARGRKKVRVRTASSPPGTPDTAAALMADILKYELSRAVSMSVDSIFKIMPRLEPHPPAPAADVVVMEGSAVTGLPHESPLRRPRQGTPPGTSPYGETVCDSTLPEVQTEALSLVVQRAPRLRPYALCRPPHQHHGEQEFPSSRRSDPQGSEGNKGGAADPVGRGKDPCGGLKQEVLATAGTPGSKARCKVNSRSVRGARHFALDPGFLGGLCVPLDVQARADGPQSILMSNLFSLNDGLTTSHLKKAKLMFFYTRYPSSLVLKTFFHDVQFTRCITSQLIKWFSNFREFYYIQMEKQARQAVAEGVAHTGALTVGRESELFRTLNMHYNKASDFQKCEVPEERGLCVNTLVTQNTGDINKYLVSEVPERFLEVAEMTLREFYVAVSLGKDCDPSWKKPIYKVICKLDSNVPEEFKAHYPD